jgi:hypothetical protein
MKKSLPKITLAFAIVGHLGAMCLYYAPVNWHLSPKIVFTTMAAVMYEGSMVMVYSAGGQIG